MSRDLFRVYRYYHLKDQTTDLRKFVSIMPINDRTMDQVTEIAQQTATEFDEATVLLLNRYHPDSAWIAVPKEAISHVEIKYTATTTET